MTIDVYPVGGAGPTTIADGDDAAQGATTDAPVTDPAAAASVLARLAGLEALLQPVSVSGTLADPAIPDALVLPLTGQQGATLVFTDISTPSAFIVNVLESFDGGATYAAVPAAYNPNYGFHSAPTQTFVDVGMALPVDFDASAVFVNSPILLFPHPGATHVRAQLTGLDGGAVAVGGHTVGLRLETGVRPARLNPTHVDGSALDQLVLHNTVGGYAGTGKYRALQVEDDGTVHTVQYTAHHAASTVTIAAGVGSVAARATRTACFLFCPSANAADVLLEGIFPVPKGVPFPVNSVDGIAFTGTNDDVIDVLEFYN